MQQQAENENDFLYVDKDQKMSESETHVFFVGGYLSQWARAPMTTELPSKFLKRAHRFSCGEQFMMASKAAIFEDFDSLIEIMREDNPKEMKALGRGVQNYDDDVWRETARDIVYLGNLAKFTQNQGLGGRLLETGDKTIVEGAWYDPVWGVGLAYDDPKILDPQNWKGTNWLGQVLVRVRADLLS